MNRRRFIVGVVGGSVASSTVLATGAFSSAETDRGVAVEVAHDRDAYLGLNELGNGKRSIIDDGKIVLRFPGFQEAIDDPALGLGKDSVYEFVSDADDDTPGLVRITNQGSNVVSVYAEHDSSSDLEIEMFDVTDPDRTALRIEPVELAPGEYVDVGFRIETFDAQSRTYDETLTIVAETPTG